METVMVNGPVMDLTSMVVHARKDLENLFMMLCLRPGWRNWQTRQTQNLVLAREWEFDPPSGHQKKMTQEIKRCVNKRMRESCFSHLLTALEEMIIVTRSSYVSLSKLPRIVCPSLFIL